MTKSSELAMRAAENLLVEFEVGNHAHNSGEFDSASIEDVANNIRLSYAPAIDAAREALKAATNWTGCDCSNQYCGRCKDDASIRKAIALLEGKA